MKRRDFAASGLTALLVGMGLPAFPSTAVSGQRRPSITALPTQRKLWSWVKKLNSFGPRLTGSPAQARAIDYLAGELSAMGLEVKRDHLIMRRWTPRTTAFQLSNGDKIEVAAPFPYSGLTPPGGVSGKMVLFNGRVQSFENARGKIAIVTVKRRDLTAFLFKLATNRRGSLPEGIDFPKSVTTPLITGLLGVPIDKAREQGVLAVVCIFEGVSNAQLRGQVLPFTTPYQDIPAIWVAQSEGGRIKAAIKQGLSGRVTLNGELKNVETDTVYAVLPGSSPDETIIVNTHTDGPNACEENGGAGILALAHYFSSLPKSARNRSLVFLLVTGHFQIPQFGRHGNQATATWLEMHPELWDGKTGHAKAVAGVTIEHLGCTEWRDDLGKGHPVSTGKLELDLIYTSNKAMSDVYIAASRGRKKIRALLVAPVTEQVMLGEGQPLYASGIPTISSCPIPDYLCQVLPGGGLERLDPDYAYQQVETFARAISLLDRMPRRKIGTVPFNLVTAIGDLLLPYLDAVMGRRFGDCSQIGGCASEPDRKRVE